MAAIARARSFPPGPDWPALWQTWHWATRPLPFLDDCAQRYGDPFTMRLSVIGPLVTVRAAELVRQVFTADPDVLTAGDSRLILEPLVGRNSVLLLDGEAHMQRRRLLLPPFHGERMHAYAVT